MVLHWPIMPTYAAAMLKGTYCAQNYVSIVHQCLSTFPTYQLQHVQTTEANLDIRILWQTGEGGDKKTFAVLFYLFGVLFS